jgi:hypothetical protein
MKTIDAFRPTKAAGVTAVLSRVSQNLMLTLGGERDRADRDPRGDSTRSPSRSSSS